MMAIFKLAISFIIVSLVLTSNAQESKFYTKSYTYTNAIDLFEKEKYSDAIVAFENIQQDKEENILLCENSNYYIAISKLKLFHKNADQFAIKTLQEIPQHSLKNDLKLKLADYYFLKRKWKNVIKWLTEKDFSRLNQAKQIEYKFKLAYALFNNTQYKKAGNYFFEIKDTDSKYSIPSTYYFAHISYEEGNYNTALKSFEKISTNSAFSFIAPYYISNIYFKLGEYKKLIAYLAPILDDLSVKNKKELNRLLGESYYQVGDYKRSTELLEQSVTANNETELFHLGNAFYNSDIYDKATEYFELSIADNDSINQLAYYKLADCYLKSGGNKKAFKAFKEASKINVYKDIKEEAAFSLAKISYDNSLDPYLESIELLTSFLKEYPNSKKYSEAQDYLLNIFLVSNNYEQSIAQMEKLNLESPKMQEAYQQAAFNLGVQQFTQKSYSESIKNFNKSKKYNTSNYINSISDYWTGEAYYRKKNYLKSIEAFKKFIFSPGAIILDEFPIAHYNIAYSYYKEKDYLNAKIWFRKFIEDQEIEDKELLWDSYSKTGDIFFMEKDYQAAIDYYKKADVSSFKNQDYILYQKAISFGLTGNTIEKQENLQKLLQKHPNSEFASESQWQLAKGYNTQENPEKAIALLNQIISKNKNNGTYKKALLEKGQILYNLGKNTEALSAYKTYISKYPNYNDANIALDQLRKIYIEENNIKEYKSYIASLSFVDLSASTLDTTSYEAAYFQYIDDNCDRAIKGFDEYINDANQKTISGVFLTPSHFYRAECFHKQSNYNQAIKDYNYVINQPFSIYTEKALVKAARISFEKKDFEDALTQYIKLEETAEYRANILEAQKYLTKLYYYTQRYDQAIDYSNKMISQEITTEEERQEAYIISARSLQETGNLNLAKKQYELITQNSNTRYYSEAMYNIALILFTNEKYAESEKQITELLSADIVNKHWLAQGLILMSDIHLVNKDAFQAKQTLISVINNHDEPAVVEIAKDKLNNINAKESKKKENEQDFVLPNIDGEDEINEEEFLLEIENDDL